MITGIDECKVRLDVDLAFAVADLRALVDRRSNFPTRFCGSSTSTRRGHACCAPNTTSVENSTGTGGRGTSSSHCSRASHCTGSTDELPNLMMSG